MLGGSLGEQDVQLRVDMQIHGTDQNRQQELLSIVTMVIKYRGLAITI
jgi:hypothetical protein